MNRTSGAVRKERYMQLAGQPLRTSAGCTLRDAGVDWDAVRVPRRIGMRAVMILGPRCGAVVEDPLTCVLYWFVTPGTAWDVADTNVLGVGATVTIPPPRVTQGGGLRWRVCPGDSDWLTDAHALRAALEDCQAAPQGRAALVEEPVR
ncbi:hypothetical protein [Streptomyces sp. NPDC047070]|uniref:hypothetical protein n=1 Tax=Streptomyces sp. NPDC047070 TaxID=3154923 RepID=UPI003454A926